MKTYNIRLVADCVAEDNSPILQLDNPNKVVDYLKGAFDAHPGQEQIWVILLDRKNKPIGRHLVTVGTNSMCLGNPSVIFRAAIVGNASAIIMSHNHPSGDPTPSNNDLSLTRKMREASNIIGIDFHDHVIIGDISSDPNGKGFYSFREAGLV